MALATRVTVTWRDRYQNEARVVFHVSPSVVDPDDPVVVAIVDLIKACVAPIGLTIELSKVDQRTGSVVTDPDYVNEDKAIFPAIDEDGQAHNFKVPGPIPSIFLGDSTRVDMTDAAVIAYVAAVTGNAVSQGGAEVNVMVTGYRSTSRKPLKS